MAKISRAKLPSLIISQHWFRWASVDPGLYRHLALPGYSELTKVPRYLLKHADYWQLTSKNRYFTSPSTPSLLMPRHQPWSDSACNISHKLYHCLENAPRCFICEVYFARCHTVCTKFYIGVYIMSGVQMPDVHHTRYNHSPIFFRVASLVPDKYDCPSKRNTIAPVLAGTDLCWDQLPQC